MNIERDALLRVVIATRLSMKLAEGLHETLGVLGVTVADDIAGFLKDALFLMSGEETQIKNDFESESNTVRLLKSDMDDGSVADWILMMDNIRRTHLRSEYKEAKQPAPQVISKERLDEMYMQNGGYKAKETETPEGEW